LHYRRGESTCIRFNTLARGTGRKEQKTKKIQISVTRWLGFRKLKQLHVSPNQPGNRQGGHGILLKEPTPSFFPDMPDYVHGQGNIALVPVVFASTSGLRVCERDAMRNALGLSP
jgi:hypothetical protein